MKKRILSLLLALVMVLSLIPTLAFAAGEDYSKVTVYFSNTPVRTRASSLRCCTCSSKCWSRST